MPASLFLLVAGCSTGPLHVSSGRSATDPASIENGDAPPSSERLGQPFWFEANVGQYPSAVRFLHRGPQHVAAVLSDGVELRWSAPSPNAGGIGHTATRTLRIQFMGASPAARLRGEAPLPATANYFIGNNASHWRHDIPLYSAVVAPIRPGVSARYYGHDGQLEFDLLLAKGVDSGLIQLKLESPAPPHIDERGDLVIEDASASGRITLHAPTVYQQGRHGNESVPGRYVLLGDGRISLALGSYDRDRPLIVDPVLSYSSYLGGSSSDTAYAVATDALGSVYVGGYTTSPDMPLQNPYQSALDGFASVYVAKFSPSGAGLTLSYATYIGNDVVEVRGLAVDSQGSAYVTGDTTSSTFPLVNPLQDHNAGSVDGYVVKLNPAGNGLEYATYFGGNSVDRARGIAVDASGAAYICGATSSTDFPIAGQAHSVFSGVVDAYVLKLAPDGRSLRYSTLIGGSGGDYAEAVTVDTAGNSAYTVGHTDSPNFPVLLATQSNLAGGVDAMLVKVDSQGGVAASTYLGGSGDESGYAVDSDGDGNIYVAGQTVSSDFPIGGPTATGRGSADDGFVVRFDSMMTRIAYARFLGGNAADVVRGMKAAGNGIVYLAGFTRSTDFPQVVSLQPVFGGAIDAFVATLSTISDTLLFSSYLGGAGVDRAYAVATDSSQNLYLAGMTDSTNFPLMLANQSINAGGSDAFLARIVPDANQQGDLAPAGSGDGVVNIADLLVLSRYVEGLASPSARDNILGDMNNDGALDLRDMLLLRRRLGY